VLVQAIGGLVGGGGGKSGGKGGGGGADWKGAFAEATTGISVPQLLELLDPERAVDQVGFHRDFN
jgi:hypothetical protein